jgi:hypothetical protein
MKITARSYTVEMSDDGIVIDVDPDHIIFKNEEEEVEAMSHMEFENIKEFIKPVCDRCMDEGCDRCQ